MYPGQQDEQQKLQQQLQQQLDDFRASRPPVAPTAGATAYVTAPPPLQGGAAGLAPAALDSETGCEVSLHLGFQGLKSRDLLSKSDPFATLEIKSAVHGKWIYMGKTAHLQNLDTGAWPESFDTHYLFEEEQRVRVRVFDFDRLKEHDFVGEAITTLGNVMGAAGQKLRVKLSKPKDPTGVKDRGYVVITGERSAGDIGGSFHMHLRAHKLDSKDWGGLGRSDPYYVIERKIGHGEDDWVGVFKSEWIKSNNNPTWKPMKITLGKLCKGILNEHLRIRVWDYDEGSKHDLIGDTYVTAADLLEAGKRDSQRFDVVHPPTKKKYQKSSYKRSGQLEVISAHIEKSPTVRMLQYIEGGLNISLTVAIDFTASNGDPNDPNSLHYMSPGRPNAYQQAIEATTSILSAYDSDGMIPVYGFGANIEGAVSQCFPLSGNHAQPEVLGVDGVMQAYQSALTYARLSGPTHFGPLLSVVNRAAYNPEQSQQAQTYNILLLLTDGAVMDMQQTIDQIVQGSSLPLSIVIVGVGQADFSRMNYLDGDDLILQDSAGRKASRDIVQFVPFIECQNNGPLLAKRTLAEIPEQIVQYFSQRGIQPNPPRSAPTDLPVAATIEEPDGEDFTEEFARVVHL
mmetsp:Transcript_22754/g.44678  ORF Transcript_22754/g.44678 Transcript_22754/m.44678 type:complete len:626 (+) Transcript_22754:490-2367(+)|eukprot:CAMPEP_0171510336 /NCGR_PEP_ID=MMETSP0959-20130129/312_1 /TAXON_ID=87120 /ORGANISM="Aurantiochytrium limacinum, Strain ATCCMYA-1381" /LENGTH=625 /DNA_ID=CAMNT_0012047699 /DNA_START=377 /DNA_END=2254 /DNA_ORIENTATION=-